MSKIRHKNCRGHFLHGIKSPSKFTVNLIIDKGSTASTTVQTQRPAVSLSQLVPTLSVLSHYHIIKFSHYLINPRYFFLNRFSFTRNRWNFNVAQVKETH